MNDQTHSILREAPVSLRTRAPAPPKEVPSRQPSEFPPQQDDPQVAEKTGGGDTPRRTLLGWHPFALAIGLVFLAAAAAGLYLYWDDAQHFQSTDDAFVAARLFPIAPKVSGYLTAVPVTDNQHVAAGDVIARIDDRDYRVALDQADAQVSVAEANIQNVDAQVSVQQAQIAANQAQVNQAQAALVFAQQQAARYHDLANKGAGTVQDEQQFVAQLHQQEAALASAQATLTLAQRQMGALNAQRNSAVASLAQVKAQRSQAQLNLSYTTITAAQPGRAVNLTAAIGQFAQPGTSLTMFVPDEIWVTANFKETQLDAMRSGQPVTLGIDAYPNRAVGGWLSDNYSWHWCFLINGPVGILTMILISLLLRESPTAEGRQRLKQRSLRFDFIGFVLVASFLGALEILLDRGLEDDWFGSSTIIAFAIICGLAFLLMIPWELTRENPVVDIRMLGTRQFGSSFIVMMATGAILFATTQFLPQLVQNGFGYSATWAGLVLSPGGLVTMVMMFVVGRLSGLVQPKYLIASGAAIVALSMYDLTNVYGDLDFWFFATSRMLLGVGLPLIFIPIMSAAYDGIPSDRTDQASALMNVARNTGGSIGISLAINVLARREQFHQSRLVEDIIPSSVNYQHTMQHVTQYFVTHGNPLLQAQQQATAWIGQQVQAQTTFLAYMDVFWTLMLLSAATVPLALMLRSSRPAASNLLVH
jgi:DHA2 family multidrug resistance protein